MKLDEIIGDVVFIAFREVERYAPIGLSENKGHFLIKGFDEFGIWVAHPGLVVVVTEGSDGKPIPPDQLKKEVINANFLVTWDNILTIMHYPDREGFDYPSEFERNIGFEIQVSKTLK